MCHREGLAPACHQAPTSHLRSRHEAHLRGGHHAARHCFNPETWRPCIPQIRSPKKGRLHLPGLVGSLQPSTPLTDLDQRAEVTTPRLVLLSCVHMHAHAGQSDTGAPSTDAEHIETTDVPTASVTICKACANPMGKRMHTCSKKRDRTASSTTERLSRASRARSDASKAPSSLVASGAAAVPVQACTSPCALSFHEKSSVPFLSFVSVGK